MTLNEAKTNYIIFKRGRENFFSRLTVNGEVIERKNPNQTSWNMVGGRRKMVKKHKGDL